MIGLFGVLSYLVGLREQEIGVRMALGADRGMILKWMLSERLCFGPCWLRVRSATRNPEHKAVADKPVSCEPLRSAYLDRSTMSVVNYCMGGRVYSSAPCGID